MYFQKGNPISQAAIQAVDPIHEALEQNKYTFGVSIDLSKALVNIDHHTLLKKLGKM